MIHRSGRGAAAACRSRGGRPHSANRVSGEAVRHPGLYQASATHLGEHSQEVLREAGYSQEQIEDFRRGGTI